jgi:hypothetical protein
LQYLELFLGSNLAAISFVQALITNARYGVLALGHTQLVSNSLAYLISAGTAWE